MSVVPARGSRRGDVGISDDAVRRATGHAWAHWMRALDRWGAKAKGHRAAAAHLRAAHGLRPWWSQMVTVEYERRRGLRRVGETAGSGVQVGVRRTMPLSAAAAWRALFGRQRIAVGRAVRLPDGRRAAVRSARAGRFVRARVAGERGSTVQVRVERARTGTTVSFHEEGMRTLRDRARAKAAWMRALRRLAPGAPRRRKR